MSGNPTGSNVVPMPKAPATAAPQMPMPMPAMWGGGGSLPWGPGCCPPGGMDALMKCYCDVQAATAFICSVMVQCIQTNPAVTAAIIAAIEASGSSLPLIGVTNGSDAQPGQVGEWLRIGQLVTLPAAATTQTVSMGIIQPGDWDVWFHGAVVGVVSDIGVTQQPLPAGFSDALQVVLNTSGMFEVVTLQASAVRASLSVPSLVVFNVTSNLSQAASSPSTLELTLMARRMR